MSRATIPSVFEEQAAKTPQAVALIYEKSTVTYGELESRANRLTHHLLRLGVERDMLVGICVDRSPDLIVALLAILKAGGAYIPLNPDFPSERIATILRDAGSDILITQSSLAGRMPSDGTSMIVIDEAHLELDTYPSTTPQVTITQDQLAYVMFTSGSTGHPKGICTTHGNVVSFTRNPQWTDGTQECVLFHSPIAFDASTYEIWVPLLLGFRVVIAPYRSLEVSRFAEAIEEGDVTSVFLTAALFGLIADLHPDCLKRIKAIWTGGDSASPSTF